MAKQIAPVSVETDTVTPIQKVFTVLTREKHQITDFRKVNGFSVTDVEVCKIPIGLGLCGDHRLGVFDLETDDLLYQIILGSSQMSFHQEYVIMGEPTRVLDLCHVVLQLIENIVKVIDEHKKDEEEEG
jgi:hypothetical protein